MGLTTDVTRPERIPTSDSVPSDLLPHPAPAPSGDEPPRTTGMGCTT